MNEPNQKKQKRKQKKRLISTQVLSFGKGFGPTVYSRKSLSISNYDSRKSEYYLYVTDKGFEQRPFEELSDSKIKLMVGTPGELATIGHVYRCFTDSEIIIVCDDDFLIKNLPLAQTQLETFCGNLLIFKESDAPEIDCYLGLSQEQCDLIRRELTCLDAVRFCLEDEFDSPILLQVFCEVGNESPCDYAEVVLTRRQAQLILERVREQAVGIKQVSCQEPEPTFFSTELIDSSTYVAFAGAFDHLDEMEEPVVMEQSLALKGEEIESLESCRLHVQEDGVFWTAVSSRSRSAMRTQILPTLLLEDITGLYSEDEEFIED